MSNKKDFGEFEDKYGDLVVRADDLGLNDVGIGFLGNMIGVLESELSDDAAKTLIDAALQLSERDKE